MKAVTFFISTLALLELGGCTVTPLEHFSDHAITISGGGDIRAANIDLPKADPDRHGDDGFALLGKDRFEAYTEQLFAAAENAAKLHEKQNLLIFVHGGLNTLKDSTEKTNELMRLYANAQLGDYFPILVNWDSGFFESYGDHLFSIRQGEDIPELAIPTSPFYFLADAGRGLARAPIDMLNSTYHDFEAIPNLKLRTNTYAQNTIELYNRLHGNPQFAAYAANVSVGREISARTQVIGRIPLDIVTWPFQMVTAPVIDAFGSPAWALMQRRAKVLYNMPEEFDIKGVQANADAGLKGEPKAVMSYFAKRLVQYQKRFPQSRITLVGHSMGSFILNALLRTDAVRNAREFEIAQIVYMAAADSVRNTFDSVLPYLQLHPGCHFYNLSLHPQNEVEETHYYIVPRGSLLVWIDDLFSTPHTQFDRTMGRWENIIQAYGAIPEDLRRRVYLKAFDQDSQISEHGSFGSARFWDPAFWQPGPDQDNPWPARGVKAFYIGPNLQQEQH